MSRFWTITASAAFSAAFIKLLTASTRLIFTALFTGLIIQAGSIQAAELDPGVRFEDVEISYSNSPELPSLQTVWAPFRLPYQVTLDLPLEYRYVWFRLALAGPVVAGENSLYLNNHLFTVDVFLNGYRVGGSNVPEGKLALGWNRPQLIPLPAALWEPDNNTLLLGLEQARYTNFLAVLRIGEHSSLQKIWQTKVFWQNQVPLVAFLLCTLMGSFALALWWQRRQDIQYGLFAGTALCWAVPMLYLSVPWDLVPHAVFLLLVYCCTLLSGLFFLTFNLRTLGLNFPRIERAFQIFVGLICLSMPLVSARNILDVVLLGQGMSLGMFAILLGYASWRALRYREVAAKWVTSSGLIILVLLVRDVYEFGSSSRSNTMISSGTYMQFSFPIALSGFFIQLLKCFVSALNQSEQLNRELGERVAAFSEQLSRSFAANRELELRKAAELQKRKIFRDLHDDVGARLVSIMHASGSTEQASLARSALVSLRETVAGTPARELTVQALIEQIAEDLEIRCRTSELEFEFQTGRQLPGTVLNANICYHLTRILQEVLTNSIKHASAARIRLNTDFSEQCLFISLTDDGKGLPAGHKASNGLRNIRHRAAEIGAHVAWEQAEPHGCRFSLTLDFSV